MHVLFLGPSVPSLKHEGQKFTVWVFSAATKVFYYFP